MSTPSSCLLRSSGHTWPGNRKPLPGRSSSGLGAVPHWVFPRGQVFAHVHLVQAVLHDHRCKFCTSNIKQLCLTSQLTHLVILPDHNACGIKESYMSECKSEEYLTVCVASSLQCPASSVISPSAFEPHADHLASSLVFGCRPRRSASSCGNLTSRTSQCHQALPGHDA